MSADAPGDAPVRPEVVLILELDGDGEILPDYALFPHARVEIRGRMLTVTAINDPAASR